MPVRSAPAGMADGLYWQSTFPGYWRVWQARQATSAAEFAPLGPVLTDLGTGVFRPGNDTTFGANPHLLVWVERPSVAHLLTAGRQSPDDGPAGRAATSCRNCSSRQQRSTDPAVTRGPEVPAIAVPRGALTCPCAMPSGHDAKRSRLHHVLRYSVTGNDGLNHRQGAQSQRLQAEFFFHPGTSGDAHTVSGIRLLKERHKSVRRVL